MRKWPGCSAAVCDIIAGMDPRKLREAVFLVCFAGEGAEALISEQLKISKTQAKLASERAQEVMAKMSELDAWIEMRADGFELKRISKAELTILRLGAFELLFDDSIPDKVAMSEAVRLCRKFSTVDSARFVNAVLDAKISGATPA